MADALANYSPRAGKARSLARRGSGSVFLGTTTGKPRHQELVGGPPWPLQSRSRLHVKTSKRRVKPGPRATGAPSPPRSGSMSTAQRDRVPDSKFAFPDKRKEPLTDAAHVRNAVARFDQVEDVTDTERDRAWRRIRTAARKYDVDIEVRGWRDLFRGGKAHEAIGTTDGNVIEFVPARSDWTFLSRKERNDDG